jgi:ceramide synthetase
LYATFYDGLEFLQGSFALYPAYYIFNFLLFSLQIMHIIWFYMILQVLKRVLSKDQKIKDERSDSESEAENDKETKED